MLTAATKHTNDSNIQITDELATLSKELKLRKTNTKTNFKTGKNYYYLHFLQTTTFRQPGNLYMTITVIKNKRSK